MDGWWLVALGAAVADSCRACRASRSAWCRCRSGPGPWIRLAAALAVFGSLTGQLLAVFSVRRGFDWKLLWPFVAGGLAGVPLGVQLLPMLDMTWFKAVLGAILAIWCPTMLFAARLPRIKGSRVGDARPDWWAA